MKYDISRYEGKPVSVTVLIDGKTYLASMEHPNFNQILDTVAHGDDKTNEQALASLFDLTEAISEKFTALSDRVTVASGQVYLDGVRQDDALTQTIIRFYAERNDDYQALVNFMEKIETNPNEHSREHLFRWLGKHDFAIAPDGDFYAYKGVTGTVDDLRSCHYGKATVNGVPIDGQVPNMPGSVVEMPRDRVTFDPATGCSTGLHAGNWEYASTFAPITLRVKINPRDVVSVPVDSYDQKLRVCRYRVDAVVKSEDRKALYVGDPERTLKVLGPKPEVPESADFQFPQWYEDFTKADFQVCDYKELLWLKKEWEVMVKAPVTRARVIAALVREAVRRRKDLDG